MRHEDLIRKLDRWPDDWREAWEEKSAIIEAEGHGREESDLSAYWALIKQVPNADPQDAFDAEWSAE
jgi:hypothetical protein